MSQQTARKQTGRMRGWLIAGASLALLFGVALLKARADTGGEDLDKG